MARPLPKMNSPAWAKYQNRTGIREHAAVALARFARERSTTANPASTMSQRGSRACHQVSRAASATMLQSSGSAPAVVRARRSADTTMMPITTAPTP